TPLQALTTLNDPAFFDAARGLARRMIVEGGLSPSEKVEYGFHMCVARQPRPAERNRLIALYRQEQTHFENESPAARSLAGATHNIQGEVECAAWTVVANVLLNLDETLTKE